jgi:spermidine synthase
MMKNNRLIYSTSDSHGPIEVYENQVLRSLHFGTRARQSAMYVDKPYLLPLSYSRYMLAPLMFLPRPERVLVLGFGAGSLCQFFHYHFRPDIDIDAVELRPEVIDVARRYFHLDEQQQDIHIHLQSALDYLRTTDLTYDLIMVDIYNDKGVDRTILEEAFFRLLQGHTREGGYISVNLWSSHPETFQQVQGQIRQQFSHCLNIPVPNKGNIIIVASNQPLPIADPALMPHAAELQTRLNVEFGIILNQTRKYNTDK